MALASIDVLAGDVDGVEKYANDFASANSKMFETKLEPS